ncbi:GNAT family N-acetyltransferase [Gaetbulibacter saemankumensis]|uniref:GNAT family N-acetyltransferase n=1 Tax=Gaetbulibacter saemankumensis TaxID=311208 RepID=UPI00048393B6|nr:GNAT family N-acetyltransferase [Gaetbulibacter saemankumensis]
MKTFHIYKSVKELPESWDTLTSHDLFLQTTYLNVLEESAPDNINCYYVGVFVGADLIGVALVQRVQLYLRDMFRDKAWSCFREYVKDKVARVLKGNILVVGNMMHTGQHGIYFKKEHISTAGFLERVYQSLDEISRMIKIQENKKIRAILFKDYFFKDDIVGQFDFFRSHHLYEVSVQPNMIMELNANWKSIEDYKSELNKKYRDRYKRAKQKFNGIESVELNLSDIKKNLDRLHELYLNVSNNAKFNTFILTPDHFYNLKCHLRNNFRVFGYYLDNELIGFYTLILNDYDLETYFLGYDKEHQYPNQLYLNMLYDMAEFGIRHHFKTVVYARTAMAIKSSVGAKAFPMVVYLKHTNVVLNALLRQFCRLMNPIQDWEERHPFK